MPGDNFNQPDGALNANWGPTWTVPNGQTPPVILNYEATGKAPDGSYSSAVYLPFSFTDSQDATVTIVLGSNTNASETYVELIKVGTEADPTEYFMYLISGGTPIQRIYKFRRADAGGVVVQIGPTGTLALNHLDTVTFRKTGPYHEIRVNGVFSTSAIDSQYTGPWRAGMELIWFSGVGGADTLDSFNVDVTTPGQTLGTPPLLGRP